MAKNRTKNKTNGVSLAKGPVALVGLALLAYGITAFILGGHSFRTDPISGAVDGETWLGLEVNAWSSLLFIGAGALLLFGAPMHVAAKSLSLIVGLVLGAASVIALYDEQDVFGIFAANGLTKLVWGAAGGLLIVLSLLPRVGGKHKQDDATVEPPRSTRRVEREPMLRERPSRIDPEPARRDATRVERDDADAGSRRAAGDDRVVAPASGTTPDSQETTRRQREHGEFR